MNDIFHLYEIDPKRRYWVIRSGHGGEYVQHFRKYNVTAIGHVDKYIPLLSLGDKDRDQQGRYQLSEEQCEAIVAMHAEAAGKDVSNSKGAVSNINGQIRRFLNEVNVGDVVVTISSHEIMWGRILSRPYLCLDSMEISLDGYDNKTSSICAYKLRRDVVWSRRYKRDTIPYVLENSFRNVSTIFEVSSSDKKSILNHWLSPAHILGDTLHLSSRIETERSIGNRSMTKLSTMLDELELLSFNIAERLKNGEAIRSDDQSLFNEGSYEYLLTTQQAFMSPGDHFIQLSADRIQLAVYAILFASLFGANLVFADEQKILIKEEDKQSIILLAKKAGGENKFEELKQDLQLKLKKPDEKVMNSTSQNEPQFPVSVNSDKTPI